MIGLLDEPIERVATGAGASVNRFAPKSSYADSFGFEWVRYQRTYSDATLGADVSQRRLELVLGFPREMLSGMTVLELGCGAGRFTEHLVAHAKQVIAVDLSDAIYVNSALGSGNLLAIHADLRLLPRLSEPVDLVFCRGVIQHTPDPAEAIRSLFRYVRPGGLIVFDVYRRTGAEWRNFKYFWRPIVQRVATVRAFDVFLSRYGEKIYRLHHALHRFWNVWRPLRRLIAKTPLYLHMNYDNEYAQLTFRQRLEIFKNELVDGFYAHHDSPMTADAVLCVLGDAGQYPYSYDLERNIFRCRKLEPAVAMRLSFSKNGVLSR